MSEISKELVQSAQMVFALVISEYFRIVPDASEVEIGRGKFCYSCVYKHDNIIFRGWACQGASTFEGGSSVLSVEGVKDLWFFFRPNCRYHFSDIPSEYARMKRMIRASSLDIRQLRGECLCCRWKETVHFLFGDSQSRQTAEEILQHTHDIRGRCCGIITYSLP